jgi:hypothetical protein
VQNAVNAESNADTVFARLNMNIRRLHLNGACDEALDKLDDGGFAGKIFKAADVFGAAFVSLTWRSMVGSRVL